MVSNLGGKKTNVVPSLNSHKHWLITESNREIKKQTKILKILKPNFGDTDLGGLNWNLGL